MGAGVLAPGGGIERDLEPLSIDETTIRDSCRRVARDGHDAVGCGELLDRHAQPCRRAIEQRLARGGTGQRQVRVVEVRRVRLPPDVVP